MEHDAVVEDGMKRGKVGEFVGDKFGDAKGHVMDLFLPHVSRWDETSPLSGHADLKSFNIPLKIKSRCCMSANGWYMQYEIDEGQLLCAQTAQKVCSLKTLASGN